MQLPLQITWRGVDRSDALEAAIRRHADKLEEYAPGIMSCHVIVGKAHARHSQGNLYSIHLDIHAPDKEIVVARDQSDKHSHEDMYVVIRDAFDAAVQQLKKYSAKRQRKVKSHELRQTAHILSADPDKDHGYIMSSDGRQIYFHRNALINARFETLKKGAAVHFVEEMGKEGPQASRVSLISHGA